MKVDAFSQINVYNHVIVFISSFGKFVETTHKISGCKNYVYEMEIKSSFINLN